MVEIIDTANAAPDTPEWWLGRLEQRLMTRQEYMTRYDDYYHGRHRLTFLTGRILEAFGKDFRDLHVNYCGVVIDALNERLSIDGLLFGDDDEASEAAWDIWQRNNLDAAFGRGTRSALTKGEFSMLVWPNERGEPRVSVEDGMEMIIAVDPADTRVRRAALKMWHDPDERRFFATLYLPRAVYKYQSQPSRDSSTVPAGRRRWERRMVDREDWPLTNPLGLVPVVPLPNRPDLAGEGESELRQVVPIQDAINANVVNVMLAGQFSAFRQKWASNVRLEIDPATKRPVEPWVFSADSLVTAPPAKPGESEVKFGEFGQTSLDGYINLHEAYVQAVATITRVPPHYFLGASGVIPSGESLRAAETGLSAKARERARDFGEPAEEAVRLTLLVKARQPGLSGRQRARFTRWAALPDAEVSWRDPETRAESAHVDAMQKLANLGIPLEAIWAMLPASPQTIRRWKRLAAAAPPPPAEAA